MPDPPLSPEEIAHHGFPSAFRGFDPGEVRAYLARVADDLRAALERERGLQGRLADAERRAAHPVLDEPTLTRALGEETGRVLASAQAAANELKAKAEEKVARILREAHEEAQRIRAQAEVVLADRTEEAAAAAAEIRRGADADAAALAERARRDAEAALAQVEENARQLVHEAQATRARVLTDLARKRRVLHAQVEQLRAGRDRLLDAYRVVRRTLDEVSEELQGVDAEARAAAEAAARRAASEPTPAGEEPDSGEERPVATAPSPHPDVALVPPGPEADGVAPHPEVPLTPPELEADVPAPHPHVPLAPPEPGPEPAVWPAAPPPEPEPTPPAPEPTPAAPEATTVEQGGPAPTAPEAGSEERAVPVPPGPAVDELFARIRADRAAAVSRAREILAGEGGRPPTAPGHPGVGGEEVAPAGDEAPGAGDDEVFLQRREAAVEELESRLGRKVKRLLQDEQNEVLDRLRSTRGRVSSAAVLPSSPEQVDRYRGAALALLREVAAAGGRFVSPHVASVPDVSDVAADLAHSVVVPLRRRLAQAIDDGGADDPAALVDRVGAAYRECKSQRVERLAGDCVVAAFCRGTLAAAPARARLRWVVHDEDGPCPDCDDNALAGPTPRGEAYPTGQTQPPAHDGCRCILVPST